MADKVISYGADSNSTEGGTVSIGEVQRLREAAAARGGPWLLSVLATQFFAGNQTQVDTAQSLDRRAQLHED